jgi:hypothetical protein
MWTTLAQKTLRARGLMALTLGLWLTGASCLACCQEDIGIVRRASVAATLRSSAGDAEHNSTAMHCPAHSSDAAVAERSDNPAEISSEKSHTSFSHSRGTTTCCPRLGQVAEHATRPRLVGAPPAASAIIVTRIAQTLSDSVAMLARMSVPDRRGTQARLCVFLI